MSVETELIAEFFERFKFRVGWGLSNEYRVKLRKRNKAHAIRSVASERQARNAIGLMCVSSSVYTLDCLICGFRSSLNYHRLYFNENH